MKWNAWAISSNKYICWTKCPFYFVSSNCKFSSQIENFEKHNLEEGHPGHSQHRMKYTPGVHQSQVFEESLAESSTKKSQVCTYSWVGFTTPTLILSRKPEKLIFTNGNTSERLLNCSSEFIQNKTYSWIATPIEPRSTMAAMTDFEKWALLKHLTYCTAREILCLWFLFFILPGAIAIIERSKNLETHKFRSRVRSCDLEFITTESHA